MTGSLLQRRRQAQYAALRTVLLLSPREIYAGPYTYKRFWFRDAAQEQFAKRVDVDGAVPPARGDSFGVTFAPAKQGTGLATEALGAVVTRLFEQIFASGWACSEITVIWHAGEPLVTIRPATGMPLRVRRR